MNKQLDDSMERHNQLYKQAFNEFMANQLEAARLHASLAAQIAQTAHGKSVASSCPKAPTSRASILLREIEWCLLLAQDQ